MVRAQLIRLETVMLDRIELLADRTRMTLTHIPNALEKGTMTLCALGQALVQQRLHAVAEQGMLVFDLGIPITLYTFNLTQVLGMCRIWPCQHFQLTVELRDAFIINSAVDVSNGKSEWEGLCGHTCPAMSQTLSPRSPMIPWQTSFSQLEMEN